MTQSSGVRAWRSSTSNSSPFTVSFTTPIVAATGNRSHPGTP
jgi:hypothetical protein